MGCGASQQEKTPQEKLKGGSGQVPKELALDLRGESEKRQLERLLETALRIEHPAIDEEGIKLMENHIKDGRFTRKHYIDMWTKRLREKDIKVR